MKHYKAVSWRQISGTQIHITSFTFKFSLYIPSSLSFDLVSLTIFTIPLHVILPDRYNRVTFYVTLPVQHLIKSPWSIVWKNHLSIIPESAILLKRYQVWNNKYSLIKKRRRKKKQRKTVLVSKIYLCHLKWQFTRFNYFSGNILLLFVVSISTLCLLPCFQSNIWTYLWITTFRSTKKVTFGKFQFLFWTK